MIELMEQAEAAQKEVARTTTEAAAAKKLVDDQIGQLNQREENLKKELAELQGSRSQLASAVDDSTRARYERLFKSKGENVVVGVEHSACGGCHMKLPAQIVTNCRGQAELGALPTLMAATANLPGGTYVGPAGPGQMAGLPKVVKPRRRFVHDEDAGRRLWELSEDATGIRYP